MGLKLLIQNLGSSIDSSELESIFSTVGDVTSAKVQVTAGPNGERRVGYVEMASEEQAKDCIDRFNGQMKNGLMLVVREDKPHVPNPDYKFEKRPTVAPKKPKAKVKTNYAARA